MNTNAITSKSLYSEDTSTLKAPITNHQFKLMLLMLCLILGYVTYQTQFNTVKNNDLGKIVKTEQLFISDDANGDILVKILPKGVQDTEGKNDKTVRYSGEQGFLRGTLRALARERHMRNITDQSPFELSLYSDSRLIISDPLTQSSIDLAAFGSDNLAVFTQLIENSNNNNAYQQSIKLKR
jgi:putative photosynthetic complex assembly protein